MIFLKLCFIQLFRTTYLKKVHMLKIAFQCIKQLRYGFSKFKLMHTKLSYLVLFLKLGTDAKQERLVWDCVKLQTSLSSLSLRITLWNFAHVLTAAVYIAWWGLKVRMEKFAKWCCHIIIIKLNINFILSSKDKNKKQHVKISNITKFQSCNVKCQRFEKLIYTRNKCMVQVYSSPLLILQSSFNTLSDFLWNITFPLLLSTEIQFFYFYSFSVIVWFFNLIF